MSLPTDPTITTIASEALQKAGYSTGTAQYTSKLSRATGSWAEEIKNDIFSLVNNPKYLQKTAAIALTANQARYQFPSDFSSPISVTLLASSTAGVVQAGGSNTITLAASDNNTEAYMEGKEIVTTNGSTSQIRQIVSFDTSTKVATVDQAWSTNPVALDLYMIVEAYDTLREMPIWEHDANYQLSTVGYPSVYYPEGEKASGQTAATYSGGFIISQTPDATFNYAIKVRYYMDVMKVDLDTATDPTITVLYRRWRNVFLQGLYAKALQDQDDNRYASEFSVYDRLLKQIQARETYGVDLNDMRMRVSE